MCKWFHTNENQKTQDLLLSQLHEQYASNNNANLSSFVTLLVSMVGVFGIFAYVFVRSSLKFSNDFQSLYDSGSELYTMDVLILSAMVSIIVLGIIKYICLYQGFHQRYEQFITYAIREKYFGKENCEKSDIFPEGYTPFGKQGLDIAQGLFGEFAKISDLLFSVILLAVFLKLLCSLDVGNCQFWMLLWILVLITVICFYIQITCQIYCLNRKDTKSGENSKQEQRKLLKEGGNPNRKDIKSDENSKQKQSFLPIGIWCVIKIIITMLIFVIFILLFVCKYNKSDIAIFEIFLLCAVGFISIYIDLKQFLKLREKYEQRCVEYNG